MKRSRVDEHPYMQHLLLALGALPWCRVWRQNTGKVLVRDERGNPLRTFNAGPPPGAADISGLVRPDGYRLEVETKAEDGDLRKEQEKWRDMIIAGGGVYVVSQYDESIDMPENVRLGVSRVFHAVTERRAR